jgi:hypothetical protein
MKKRGSNGASGWAGQWDRHRWKMPQQVPTRGRRRSYTHQLVGGAAVAALIGWVEAPLLTSIWTQLTSTPEEIARVERSVTYRHCSVARAAGAAPIYKGSPGYRRRMDADSDGIACEPYL